MIKSLRYFCKTFVDFYKHRVLTLKENNGVILKSSPFSLKYFKHAESRNKTLSQKLTKKEFN